jgi:isoleucyl-tRNA synthetase
VDQAAIDQELLARMELAMQVSSLGRSARSAAYVKLRQPLAGALVAVRQPTGLRTIENLAELVADELNVKTVQLVDSEADLVTYEIGLLPNLLGPKLGHRFPLLRKAVAQSDAAALARRLQAGLSVTVELGDGGPAVEVLPEETEVRLLGREGYAVAEEKGIVVAIDIRLTPELVQEGLARDLVRRVQTLRKEADFQLDDRILLYYETGDELQAVVEAWRDYIRAETLSLDLVPGPLPEGLPRQESFKLEGHPISLGVRKA